MLGPEREFVLALPKAGGHPPSLGTRVVIALGCFVRGSQVPGLLYPLAPQGGRPEVGRVLPGVKNPACGSESFCCGAVPKSSCRAWLPWERRHYGVSPAIDPEEARTRANGRWPVESAERDARNGHDRPEAVRYSRVGAKLNSHPPTTRETYSMNGGCVNAEILLYVIQHGADEANVVCAGSQPAVVPTPAKCLARVETVVLLLVDTRRAVWTGASYGPGAVPSAEARPIR
mmetsp:Transcript_81702/g.243614  ORF Transcript_81702/g.243614 Transcript_81702/m.243614 type:complete len:231 (-) Transcript_81702:1206-1898(-)